MVNTGKKRNYFSCQQNLGLEQMKSIHSNYGGLNRYISLMMVIPLQHIAKDAFCCLSDLSSSQATGQCWCEATTTHFVG